MYILTLCTFLDVCDNASVTVYSNDLDRTGYWEIEGFLWFFWILTVIEHCEEAQCFLCSLQYEEEDFDFGWGCRHTRCILVG